jgi:hypothetical protein
VFGNKLLATLYGVVPATFTLARRCTPGRFSRQRIGHGRSAGRWNNNHGLAAYSSRARVHYGRPIRHRRIGRGVGWLARNVAFVTWCATGLSRCNHRTRQQSRSDHRQKLAIHVTSSSVDFPCSFNEPRRREFRCPAARSWGRKHLYPRAECGTHFVA